MLIQDDLFHVIFLVKVQKSTMWFDSVCVKVVTRDIEFLTNICNFKTRLENTDAASKI